MKSNPFKRAYSKPLLYILLTVVPFLGLSLHSSLSFAAGNQCSSLFEKKPFSTSEIKKLSNTYLKANNYFPQINLGIQSVLQQQFIENPMIFAHVLKSKEAFDTLVSDGMKAMNQLHKGYKVGKITEEGKVKIPQVSTKRLENLYMAFITSIIYKTTEIHYHLTKDTRASRLLAEGSAYSINKQNSIAMAEYMAQYYSNSPANIKMKGIPHTLHLIIESKEFKDLSIQHKETFKKTSTNDPHRTNYLIATRTKLTKLIRKYMKEHSYLNEAEIEMYLTHLSDA